MLHKRIRKILASKEIVIIFSWGIEESDKKI